MAEGRCAKCARFFLIVFNFIFWLSGGAIMGMGIFLLVSNEVESTLSELIDMNIPLEFIYTSACIMIGVGSFVFFVGFCGCCGAMRESAIMLAVYIICMCVVMIGEITAGIYVAVEKSNIVQVFLQPLHCQIKIVTNKTAKGLNVEKEVKRNWQSGIETTVREDLAFTVRNYTGHGNSTIDFIQVKFHCCGSENYTDYQDSIWFMDQSAVAKYYVPKTCCVGEGKDAKTFHPEDYESCNLEAQSLSQPWDTFAFLYPQGCYDSLLGWLDDQSWTLIGVVIGVAEIEIVGIVFAVLLCRNRTEYYD